jgi:hypothetical protein
MQLENQKAPEMAGRVPRRGVTPSECWIFEPADFTSWRKFNHGARMLVGLAIRRAPTFIKRGTPRSPRAATKKYDGY